MANRLMLKTGVALFALSPIAATWAAGCKFEKNINEQLDLRDAQQLVIAAAAGSLEVTGAPGATHAVVRGRACASRAEWAEQSGVALLGGPEAEIAVDLPQIYDSLSFGNRYVYMDLEIEVPSELTLDIRDSSGEMRISDVGALTIHDSSGDIDIDRTSGPVRIRDSSGGIDARDIGGDFTIVSDSSGEVIARGVAGSVLVEHDSSGELEFFDIEGDVLVEEDSSGSIRAERVSGSFTVLRDGSGDIDSRDIAGEVRLPRGKG